MGCHYIVMLGSVTYFWGMFFECGCYRRELFDLALPLCDDEPLWLLPALLRVLLRPPPRLPLLWLVPLLLLRPPLKLPLLWLVPLLLLRPPPMLPLLWLVLLLLLLRPPPRLLLRPPPKLLLP